MTTDIDIDINIQINFGPLLFLLYIIDLPQALSDTYTYLCADQIYISFITVMTLCKSKVL